MRNKKIILLICLLIVIVFGLFILYNIINSTKFESGIVIPQGGFKSKDELNRELNELQSDNNYHLVINGAPIINSNSEMMNILLQNPVDNNSSIRVVLMVEDDLIVDTGIISVGDQLLTTKVDMVPDVGEYSAIYKIELYQDEVVVSKSDMEIKLLVE